MFRAPLCPSSGAHDDSVWLPCRSSGSRVAAGWNFSVGRMDKCPDFGPDIYPSCLHFTEVKNAWRYDSTPHCLHEALVNLAQL